MCSPGHLLNPNRAGRDPAPGQVNLGPVTSELTPSDLELSRLWQPLSLYVPSERPSPPQALVRCPGSRTPAQVPKLCPKLPTTAWHVVPGVPQLLGSVALGCPGYLNTAVDQNSLDICHALDSAPRRQQHGPAVLVASEVIPSPEQV